MRFIYALLVLILISPILNGQKLDFNSLDKQKLGHEVLAQLTVLRDTQALSAFQNKEALSKLATIQGKYCVKHNKTSHLQESKKYHSLQDRAKSLDLRNSFLEEIIVSIDFKKLKSDSYETLAKSLCTLMLKNKSYTGALLNDAYIETGWSVDLSDNLLFFTLVVASKETPKEALETPSHFYHIKTTASDKNKVCVSCLKKLDAMPADVFYDLTRQEETIYFVISSEEWFFKIFGQKQDGIAVDIVRKAQFPCNLPNIEPQSTINYGYLLPPVYTKDLVKNAVVDEKGRVFVPVGTIPEIWKNEQYELNILILQDNILCRYGTFFQVPFGKWQTLNLDYDLSISSSKGSFETEIEKNLQFVVPFEKGKYTFDSLDLKPLADSLRLSHYDIKNLEVMAYSSVEGSKALNLELQQKRANSIVEAIKTYQNTSFASSIKSAENWASFFEDIQKSSKAFLATKTEQEIRNYLANNASEEMEKILSQHRKAIINIQLHKKQLYDTLNSKVIDKLLESQSFNATDDKYSLIDETYLTKNLELLDYLSQSLKTRSDWNASSKAKLAMYEVSLDTNLIAESLRKISGYLVEDSQNPMIQYNYYVLKLKEWENRLMLGEPPVILKKQIWANNTISKEKLDRLKINYLILETSYYTEKQSFTVKNQLVNTLMPMLLNMNLADEEKYRLGKFLAAHHQYNAALKLLEPSTKASSVHENLLFLYINLSIIDDRATQKTDFRTCLANASVLNMPRFCKLFDSSLEGGITFQLLRNKYLKRSYCDICN